MAVQVCWAAQQTRVGSQGGSGNGAGDGENLSATVKRANKANEYTSTCLGYQDGKTKSCSGAGGFEKRKTLFEYRFVAVSSFVSQLHTYLLLIVKSEMGTH